MLTVETGQHLLMKRFQCPDAGKRFLVIVPREHHEGWLTSDSTDEAQSFLQTYPVDAMLVEPFPLPPRATSKKSPEAKG